LSILLWILDTAEPGFSSPVAGGAKLVAVDLTSDKVVKTIVLPSSTVLPTTAGLAESSSDPQCYNRNAPRRG